MIANRKLGIGVLLAAMLVISTAFVPTVSAETLTEDTANIAVGEME